MHGFQDHARQQRGGLSEFGASFDLDPYPRGACPLVHLCTKSEAKGTGLCWLNKECVCVLSSEMNRNRLWWGHSSWLSTKFQFWVSRWRR